MRKRGLTQEFTTDNSDLRMNGVNISGTDFALAISKFAKEHLLGAMEVEIVGESDGIISISPTLTAHTLKSLLSCAAPDEILKARITFSDNMSISVLFEKTPEADDIAKVMSFAKACGFSAKRDARRLIFTVEINFTDTLQIYAVSADIFEKELQNTSIL